MSLRSWLLGSVAILATSASAWAAPIINVGTIELLPNTANQTFPILVSGGDAVQGLTFWAQVADGGPGLGGAIDGPNITNVDIVGAGTIFNGNNTGSGGVGAVEQQYYEATTTTNTGTVAASGTLAFVTVDTTGLTSGSFAFLLKDTLTGDTDFGGVPATITNGTLSIVSASVPEPTTFAAMAVVGGMLALRRRA